MVVVVDSLTQESETILAYTCSGTWKWHACMCTSDVQYYHIAGKFGGL